MCHCNKYCYNIVDTMFLFQLTQHEIHVAPIDLHIRNVKIVWFCIKFIAFGNFLKKCVSMCDKQSSIPIKDAQENLVERKRIQKLALKQ